MKSNDDNIDQIRSGIDEIDGKILQLLAQRRAFSVRAARLKGAQGHPSRSPLREEDMIAERIAAGLEHQLDSRLINRMWREIVDDSVRVQRDLLGRRETDDGLVTVAIQGVEGSYSQLASQQIFDAKGGRALAYVTAPTFADAIKAVREGRADVAVLPIENTTSGAISEVYDLLLDSGLHVVGDLRFRVRHCLLGVGGADVDGLERIYARSVIRRWRRSPARRPAGSTGSRCCEAGLPTGARTSPASWSSRRSRQRFPPVSRPRPPS
jgi:chorismate mutase/prephenate dehydratase